MQIAVKIYQVKSIRMIFMLPTRNCHTGALGYAEQKGVANAGSQEVTRLFGQKAAVNRISFEITGPAFVGIIGRSGAGKSTFLRMMNRLTDATAGEILVEGRNILALKGLPRGLGSLSAP